MHKYEMSQFPDYVLEVLQGLITESSTQSIWFIGSRANDSERADSDWDFIAFVKDNIHESSVRHSDVDVIRVDENSQYLLEGQSMNLSGSFKTWNWRLVNSESALYTVRKTPVLEVGQAFNLDDVRYIDLKGLKVWERNA